MRSEENCLIDVVNVPRQGERKHGGTAELMVKHFVGGEK